MSSQLTSLGPWSEDLLWSEGFGLGRGGQPRGFALGGPSTAPSFAGSAGSTAPQRAECGEEAAESLSYGDLIGGADFKQNVWCAWLEKVAWGGFGGREKPVFQHPWWWIDPWRLLYLCHHVYSLHWLGEIKRQDELRKAMVLADRWGSQWALQVNDFVWLKNGSKRFTVSNFGAFLLKALLTPRFEPRKRCKRSQWSLAEQSLCICSKLEKTPGYVEHPKACRKTAELVECQKGIGFSDAEPPSSKLCRPFTWPIFTLRLAGARGSPKKKWLSALRALTRTRPPQFFAVCFWDFLSRSPLKRREFPGVFTQRHQRTPRSQML